MKKLLLAAALAIAPTAGLATQDAAPPQAEAAAPRPDADPALWVVRDDDTTIYLFGTFHLLDGQHDWFNDEVRTAFDSSSELVIEMIAPEPAQTQQIATGYARAAEGQLLSQRLPAELYEGLTTRLAASGIPAANLEGFDPWFVANLLSLIELQKLGFSGEAGVETILTAAARERQMRLGEVETMQEQLEIFDSMPEAMQVAQVAQTIELLDGLEAMIGTMVTAWSSGDTEGIAALINEGMDTSPELYRLLLSDRNARWSEWIERRLAQPGTIFMAVGAGHLGGRDSVQDFLERRGLRTERVTNTAPSQPGS